MPLLLYCVAPETSPETSVTGVGGEAVLNTVARGLKFYYSEAVAEAMSSRDVVTAAQAVHAVVSDIFLNGPVLPFKYPTVVADLDEIARLASDRGDAYGRFLERVGSRVQMDVRLTLESEGPPAATSGRAYLQGRARRQATLSAAAERCRLAAASAEWRTQTNAENIRCQALMERVEVLSFLERMRTLGLPDGVKAAVSGPWPPAGFWDNELL